MEPLTLPLFDLFRNPAEAFRRLRESGSLFSISFLYLGVMFVSYFFSSRFTSFDLLKVLQPSIDSLGLHVRFAILYALAVAAGILMWLAWTSLAHGIARLCGGKGNFRTLLVCSLFVECVGQALRQIIFVASMAKLIFAPLFYLRTLVWLVYFWEIYLLITVFAVLYELPLKKAFFSLLTAKVFEYVLILFMVGIASLIVAYRQVAPKGLVGMLQAPRFEVVDRPADLNWKIKSLDGKSFSLAEADGKVVFLNFWATWCPPCVAEMKSIQQAYDQLKNEKVLFVCVSDEDPETIKKFLGRTGYTLPIYSMTGRPPEVFGSDAVPATFIISPSGWVIAKHIGASQWDSVESLHYLRKLLPDKSAAN